jgi:hypothetical protein
MEESERDKMREKNQKGEFIYRLHNQYFFQTPLPHFHSKEPYPWERSFVGTQPKITKEFFRCNGSGLNPSRIVQDGKEAVHYFDCGGVDKHSLPLREGKEFIYPVLIDLLNLIQAKTGKKVVITSAYRCPEHNTYVDPSPANQFSKHLIGAEVDFYVQGMENSPEKIIKMIMQYYLELFPDQKDYANFERYDRLDTNVSTPPWYNKEIFIKLFQKHEGRNFDNRHPYPYISIQVRYDSERKEKVNYSWDQANRNYLRK